jgi:hypothetical protein
MQGGFQRASGRRSVRTETFSLRAISLAVLAFPPRNARFAHLIFF